MNEAPTMAGHMDEKTMHVDLEEGQLGNISIGDKVEVTTTGTVKSLDAGRKKDKDDEYDNGYSPNMCIVVSTTKVRVKSDAKAKAYDEMADEEER